VPDLPFRLLIPLIPALDDNLIYDIEKLFKPCYGVAVILCFLDIATNSKNLKLNAVAGLAVRFPAA
jgi:hypothetical protein